MRCKGFYPLALLAISWALVPVSGWSQQFTKSDRELAESMLREADADVRKHYYDSKLHGVDWPARVQELALALSSIEYLRGI